MDLGGVKELVDGIAGVDSECRDRERLVAAVAAVASVRRWLDGRDVQLAASLASVDALAEQSFARAGRTSPREADRALERGRTASKIPELGAALAAGDVSGGHVDAVTDVLRSAEPAVRDQLVADGRWIARRAGALTPAELRRELQAARRGLETDQGMSRLERQRRACRLKSWVDRDGMWRFEGWFDPETGIKLHQRILTQSQAQFAEAVPEHAPDDPAERQSFLRALALDALTKGAGGRAGAPEIIAVVDTTATDTSGGPVVDWGLPVEIPIQVLHDLYPQAQVTPVIVRNGVVLYAPGTLDLGRTSRLANRDQRRVLRALYPTCAIPGCDTRYDLCKIHHVIWWEHHGPTDLDNLLPVCVKHHHAIHDGGWELKLGPDRTLTITYPNGRTHTTNPPRRC